MKLIKMENNQSQSGSIISTHFDLSELQSTPESKLDNKEYYFLKRDQNQATPEEKEAKWMDQISYIRGL